jgi:hypothetical protein
MTEFDSTPPPSPLYLGISLGSAAANLPSMHPLVNPNAWGLLNVTKIIKKYNPDAIFSVTPPFYQYELELTDGGSIQTGGIQWDKSNKSPKPSVREIYTWASEILQTLYEAPPNLSGLNRKLIYLPEYRTIINSVFSSNAAVAISLALSWREVKDVQTLLNTVKEWNGIVRDLIPDLSIFQNCVAGLQDATIRNGIPIVFQQNGTIKLEQRLYDTLYYYHDYELP